MSGRARSGLNGGLILAIVLTYVIVGLVLFALGYAIGRILL